jgi:large subunit ribosomal protein L7/L12
MADLKDFTEQLVNLTVKEVNELAAILRDGGIEPAAAAVAMAGPGRWREAAEEQTEEFDVIIKLRWWHVLDKLVKELLLVQD